MSRCGLTEREGRTQCDKVYALSSPRQRQYGRMKHETRELGESRHEVELREAWHVRLPVSGGAKCLAICKLLQLEARSTAFWYTKASSLSYNCTFGAIRAQQPRDYHNLGAKSSPTLTGKASGAHSNIRSQPDQYVRLSMEMLLSIPRASILLRDTTQITYTPIPLLILSKHFTQERRLWQAETPISNCWLG